MGVGFRFLLPRLHQRHRRRAQGGGEQLHRLHPTCFVDDRDPSEAAGRRLFVFTTRLPPPRRMPATHPVGSELQLVRWRRHPQDASGWWHARRAGRSASRREGGCTAAQMCAAAGLLCASTAAITCSRPSSFARPAHAPPSGAATRPPGRRSSSGGQRGCIAAGHGSTK